MILRIFALQLVVITSIDSAVTPNSYDEKLFEKVRLGQEGFDKAKLIHHNWYLHSIKAIMGQLGQEILPELDKGPRLKFLRCLDNISDRRDIVAAGKCLIEARNTIKTKHHKQRDNQRLANYQSIQQISFTAQDSNTFIQHAKIPNRLNYTCHLQKTMKTMLNKLRRRRFLHRIRRHQTNKKESTQTSIRSKRSPHRLIADELSKSDSDSFEVVNAEKITRLADQPEKSVIERFANLIQSLIRGEREVDPTTKKSKWLSSYKSLLSIKKDMDRSAQSPGAKVYGMRMLDLVLDRKRPTQSKQEKLAIPDTLKNAMHLTRLFEDAKLKDGGNIKFMSPRIAALMPDRNDARGSFSPSILPMYKDDAEEQILPVPKLNTVQLLEDSGMKESDREAVLETVMELSGARETVDDAVKILRNMNLLGLEGELMEVTERLTKHFLELEESFNHDQKEEIKTSGYTFMEPEQIEDLHKKYDIHNRTDIEFNIDEYRNLTNSERKEALWKRIEVIANNGTEAKGRRTKRQFEIKHLISVGNPTILAPYMFAPVFGLTVLGPVIMSPNIFSPLILDPVVLSPNIMSPAVAMPFILSPYLLTPFMMSPMMMAPFILNPYVLSPNVLNPYALSPVILSPLVLSPDVLSPMTLGGNILSPSVLSPSVLSKSFVMVNVLSPTLLS